ncbi:MAG: hypothetical protein AAB110_08840 [Candidatus Desantisbacteria bacterium]
MIRDSVRAYYVKDEDWEPVDKQDVSGERLTFYMPHLSLAWIAIQTTKAPLLFKEGQGWFLFVTHHLLIR